MSAAYGEHIGRTLVLNGLEELRERLVRPVVTIGNFDGVHLGHQALFAKTLERARAIEGTAVAMTFEPHPMRVLRPAVNLPLITPLSDKLCLMAGCGLEVIVVARFDQDFAALSADDFVDKLLVHRLHAAEVVVGYDFAFGHKGLGDLELLAMKGESHGFGLNVVGPVMLRERPVSSTRIRQDVRACRVDSARELLGRHHRVSGHVARGFGRGGRLLGFPTANLAADSELLPSPGVYAVLAGLGDGRVVPGVTNVGNNPTFGNQALSVETHLLDFSEDLYGQPFRLDFVEHLRGEKKFNGIEELAAQIAKDVEKARKVLQAWI